MSAVSIAWTVEIASTTDRPLPAQLEKIVSGSHPSLGNELHSGTFYINTPTFFRRLGNRSRDGPQQFSMILRLTAPDQFGADPVASLRLVSTLNRRVFVKCWKGDRLNPAIAPGRHL